MNEFTYQVWYSCKNGRHMSNTCNECDTIDDAVDFIAKNQHKPNITIGKIVQVRPVLFAEMREIAEKVKERLGESK